jgi:anaerobic ribonucleoside-triphosphate reductase activating protein
VDKTIRVHNLCLYSRANGPGLRTVIWVQGCTLGCPRCFNPATHPVDGGQPIFVSDLVAQIMAVSGQLEGITISGGEPLQQIEPLFDLLQQIRRKIKLSVIVLTGYTWHEAQQIRKIEGLLSCIDVLIAGRYEHTQRLAEGLRGSANKTIHFLSNRYTSSDLRMVPAAEIMFTADGEMVISGIDPPRIT